MADLCGFEIYQYRWCVRAFSPPGGTRRLHGRQDARRYREIKKPRIAPGLDESENNLFAATEAEEGQTAQTRQRNRLGFRNDAGHAEFSRRAKVGGNIRCLCGRIAKHRTPTYRRFSSSRFRHSR